MNRDSVTIHPTAIVDPAAVLGEGTTVGPYSIIGPRVVIGRENWIGPHVVIEGNTSIGDENKVFQFASIGSVPQDLKYRGEDSELKIGHKNIIREYVTLQPGTAGGGMLTAIGSSNLFMANCHVGHDCVVGDRCILANSAGLSGHVTLGNGVVIGGLSGIHQFVRLGDLAMIGGGAMVTEDIPPFCTAQGDRARLQGLNKVGLERNGTPREELTLLRRLYRLIFVPGLPETRGKGFRERIEIARPLVGESKRAQDLIEFITSSNRGVARHYTRAEGDNDDI